MINPDIATRDGADWGGTQAGTVRGELARSVMQFKSFPIAMISRHWRMLEARRSGCAGTGEQTGVHRAALMRVHHGTGRHRFQTKQIVQGKDQLT